MIPRVLTAWQYRTYTVPQDESLDAAARAVALQELGLTGAKPTEAQEEDVKDAVSDVKDLNTDLKTRYIRVPAGFHLRLPKDKTYIVPEAAYLGDLAREQLGTAGKAELLFSLNLDRLIRLPNGAKLTLSEDKQILPTLGTSTAGLLVSPLGPAPLLAASALTPGRTDRTYVVENRTALPVAAASTAGLLVAPAGGPPLLAAAALVPGRLENTEVVPEGETLADVARDALGSAEKAQTLYRLNEDALRPAVTLPAGAVLKVPQQTWPAVVMFGLLTLFLVAVGLGWLFRQLPTPAAAAGPAAPPPAP